MVFFQIKQRKNEAKRYSLFLVIIPTCFSSSRKSKLKQKKASKEASNKGFKFTQDFV